MRLIYKEHQGISYQKYEFPYCIYAIKEPTDRYVDLYSKGFLPYTNDFSINDEIYYLARSVRIDLQQETLFNYKQKNLFNKLRNLFPDNEITISLVDKERFINDPIFIRWCIVYAKDHFLTEERLQYILSRPYLRQIMQIWHKDRLLANLFLISEDEALFHIWFNFYDTTITQSDFGKWILLQTIMYARRVGYKHYYIGTCYGNKAFYKLTLSPHTSYFNGEGWDLNIEKLKKNIISSLGNDLFFIPCVW